MSRVLVAIGGNALITGQAGQITSSQWEKSSATAAGIIPLIRQGHQVLLTHGNGPQVGLSMQRAQLATNAGAHKLPGLPLWAAVSESQGSIGTSLQLAMMSGLSHEGIDREVVTVITHCLVDRCDPAFSSSDKPIGLPVPKTLAPSDWDTVPVAKGMVRRVVSSPEPKRVMEQSAISTLMGEQKIVIAGGGGGIPVIRRAGQYLPVDGVIDKDQTSALIAINTQVEVLLLLTAVPQLCLNWGTADEKPIKKTNCQQLESWYKQGQFPPGSMGPKINAACRFLKNGGKRVVITNIESMIAAFDGTAGTQITKE